MVIVTIEVSNCNECPYYTGMITQGTQCTYGECEKIGGNGKNEDLMEFCPFKEESDKKKEYWVNEETQTRKIDDIEFKVINGGLYWKKKEEETWYTYPTNQHYIDLNKDTRYCEHCGYPNLFFYTHCRKCGKTLRSINQSEESEEKEEDIWDFKLPTYYDCLRCENYLPNIKKCHYNNEITFNSIDNAPFRENCKNYKEKKLKFDCIRKPNGKIDYETIFCMLLLLVPFLILIGFILDGIGVI